MVQTLTDSADLRLEARGAVKSMCKVLRMAESVTRREISALLSDELGRERDVPL
jgi:hypothetical protein